jgi:hypothetical protein
VTDLVAVVEFNLGRWAAPCPTPYCRGAEHYGIQPAWLGPPRIGGLSLDAFVCLLACQRAYPARWPDAEMRKGIEALLNLRPDWANRNWKPPETLHDLLQENADHDIGVPVLEPERGGRILTIGDDRIIEGMDALLEGGKRPELATPAVLKAIGGG